MRPVPWFFLQGDYCFNPRICKRCDQTYKRSNTLLWSFNPRICKRCDGRARDIASYTNQVSIHASVKDATIRLTDAQKTQVVSIHASVKDATIGNWIKDRGYFNVSIHASVKDATYLTCRKDKRYSFNPRICKRCD